MVPRKSIEYCTLSDILQEGQELRADALFLEHVMLWN